MTRSSRIVVVAAVSLISLGAYLLRAVEPKTPPQVITGKAAFADFSEQKPGTFRKITLADLPPPFATGSPFNHPSVRPRPTDSWPPALPGCQVERSARGL